ncbi:hypothetical protein [Streptomyces luteireticuli]|uniref:hypothetical protein n=1 Tax=Streptomyces luteireticuli TaxID=173858 RepID=UPI003557B681
MTDGTGITRGEGRGVQILFMLVLTVLFLAPCLWVWSWALDAFRYPSTHDWKSNHDNSVQFVVMSAVVFGVPSAGRSWEGLLQARVAGMWEQGARPARGWGTQSRDLWHREVLLDPQPCDVRFLA